MPPASTRQVPAVSRAFDILDLFLDGKGARSVPEITAALRLPRSTTHELVQTLVARNCLRPVDGQPHRYDLALHLFELGSAYASSIDLTQQGQLAARALVDRCGESVHVAALEAVDVFYLVKVDSTQAVRMVSPVGRRLPAHCTAVGKVLLAGLTDDEVIERYAAVDEWTKMTRNSVSSIDALLADLAATRKRGLAFDDCESNVDVRCVAAPVRDASGDVIAGMSISVPAHRSDRLAGELADLVSQAARDLSASLGHVSRL